FAAYVDHRRSRARAGVAHGCQPVCARSATLHTPRSRLARGWVVDRLVELARDEIRATRSTTRILPTTGGTPGRAAGSRARGDFFESPDLGVWQQPYDRGRRPAPAAAGTGAAGLCRIRKSGVLRHDQYTAPATPSLSFHAHNQPTRCARDQRSDGQPCMAESKSTPQTYSHSRPPPAAPAG